MAIIPSATYFVNERTNNTVEIIHDDHAPCSSSIIAYTTSIMCNLHVYYNDPSTTSRKR